VTIRAPFSRWFLAWLVLWPWNWGYIFLRNVSWLSTDHMALYDRIYISSIFKCFKVFKKLFVSIQNCQHMKSTLPPEVSKHFRNYGNIIIKVSFQTINHTHVSCTTITYCKRFKCRQSSCLARETHGLTGVDLHGNSFCNLPVFLSLMQMGHLPAESPSNAVLSARIDRRWLGLPVCFPCYWPCFYTAEFIAAGVMIGSIA
jgi:hypothetical protein